MSVLSICIPTFNRGPYLEKCLKAVTNDMERLGKNKDKVEILIFDNDSRDDTAQIVKYFSEVCDKIKYSKNEKNLGSDYNIAQCYNNGTGNYVWVLGDDEQITPNTLTYVLDLIENADHEYGAIYLNAYSYNDEEFKPPPNFKGIEIVSNDTFLKNLHVKSVFISSIIVKNNPDIDAQEFVGTWLAQFHYLLKILTDNKTQLITHRYSLVAKRENWADVNAGLGVKAEPGTDERTCVLVANKFLSAIKSYKDEKSLIEPIKYRVLFNYVIFELAYVKIGTKSSTQELKNLEENYKGNWYFRWYVRPLLRNIKWWPCRILLVLTCLLSRSVNGEFLKILYFVLHNFRFSLAKLK